MKYNEILSHEIACRVLERDANAFPDLSMRPEGQRNAITNYIKLLDIAEAINKVDGFTPDYNNTDQEKWFPVFDGSDGFAFSFSIFNFCSAYTYVGSRLSFRTEEIADFFGKQFNELHKYCLTLTK